MKMEYTPAVKNSSTSLDILCDHLFKLCCVYNDHSWDVIFPARIRAMATQITGRDRDCTTAVHKARDKRLASHGPMR